MIKEKLIKLFDDMQALNSFNITNIEDAISFEGELIEIFNYAIEAFANSPEALEQAYEELGQVELNKRAMVTTDFIFSIQKALVTEREALLALCDKLKNTPHHAEIVAYTSNRLDSHVDILQAAKTLLEVLGMPLMSNKGESNE
jgi:hypothetical protein